MFDNFFKGSVSIIPSLKDNRFLKMPCEKEIFAFFNQYKRNGLFLEKYFSDGMLASFVLHQLEINTNISISLTYKNFMQFLYKITEGKKDNYISFYTFYNKYKFPKSLQILLIHN